MRRAVLVMAIAAWPARASADSADLEGGVTAVSPISPVSTIWGARGWLARLAPKLRLGLALGQAEAPARRAWSIESWALLSWPLDAVPRAGARARVGPSARQAAFADERMQRIAAAWRRRQETLRHLDSEEGQLDAEEAEAELEARSGEWP